jgi:hypothetical protein
VRVFKTSWFARFAGKEGITDEELREVVSKLEAGQSSPHGSGGADLGGGVYKIRVARPGESKAGGYRVIMFFRSKERAFFVYGFAKSDRGNIDQGELREFKKKAKVDFLLTDEQIEDRLRDRTLFEVF